MFNLPDFVNEGEQGNKNEQEGLSTPILSPPRPGNLQVPLLARPRLRGAGVVVLILLPTTSCTKTCTHSHSSQGGDACRGST